MPNVTTDDERTLGFLRLSTEDSITEQRHRIAEWCADHDYTIDGFVAFSNPAVALDAVQEGDSLIVNSYVQISRDFDEFLTFAQHCNDRDIHVITIAEQIVLLGRSASADMERYVTQMVRLLC